MTPAENYREAENLAAGAIRRLERATENTYADAKEAAHVDLAAAQVHATLALAGATFLAAMPGYDTDRDAFGDALHGLEPWRRVVAGRPETMAENAARLAREAGYVTLTITAEDKASEALAGIAARVAREAGR